MCGVITVGGSFGIQLVSSGVISTDSPGIFRPTGVLPASSADPFELRGLSGIKPAMETGSNSGIAVLHFPCTHLRIIGKVVVLNN